MKKLTSILAAVILTASIWAQSPQKMSYQAVIRDASNALVTNTTVGMQISILQTTSTGTAVYVETQTPTTNANGLVSIEIGGGTIVSGTFSTIDWAAGPYFIKTETDPAGGSTYSITGTSQLLSVPYALSAGNVTGLEKITEGGNTGWRLIGQDPVNYGNIGVNATDLSYSNSSSTTLGATGANSTALGEETIASGKFSTAMGFGTIASGNTSTAIGLFTEASGDYSTSMGNNTRASGKFSTAMGDHTGASGDHSTSMGFGVGAYSYASVAMGQYNIGGGNATTWVDTDPLFEIGNGTSNTALKNALTILKNGTITAPSFDLAEITNAKALITKEYADTNLTASGLEKITENFQTGWRLTGRNSLNYGNIGVGATDLSYSNLASTVNGATGYYSTALGQKTIALGDNSMAMGFTTKAEAFASTALGEYNIGGGNATTWVDTDPLFEIGNGTSSTPSNALTVLKNGNTDVNGVFRAQNNVWPTTGEGIEIAYDGSLGRGYVQSYDRGTSTWKDLVLGGVDVYPVLNGTINLGTSTNKWKAVYAVNGTIQTSDKRLKKEINNIKYGLKTVMQLRPVSYKWKKGNQDLNLGLIAQEVQKLIPEVIDVGTDKDKTLGMKYTALIPVVIKATQEQQKIIEKQQKEINELKKMVNKLLQKKILVSAN